MPAARGKGPAKKKRSGEELRQSQRLLRQIFEGTSDAVFVKDMEGRYLLFNSAAGQVTGKTPADVLGKDDTFLFPPDVARAVMEGDRRVMASGRIQTLEDRVRDAAGEHRVFLSTKGPIYDEEGNAIGLFGISRDITERKQAEEKLRLTQFAVDNFTDSSIWMTRGGRIIYINQATCQSLGYTRDELLSMRIWDIDPDYDRQRYLELWNALKPKGALKFETTHLRKDGSTYPVEVSVKYVEFEDREYMVTFDRDITRRKRNEQELSLSRAQAELYLDLMSHDIRNMNQIGMGFLELALGSSAFAGKDREYLLKAMGSLENSTRLIDNVKKMRQAQAGELRLHEVDACEAIQRVLDHYRSDAGVRAQFSCELPASCPVVADDLLYEVFENLIGNAIRHGGPEPAIGIRFDTVDVNHSTYYRIVVEDNGPGIPDDVKARLFRRGQTQVKGRGMGLYLVSALVKSYDGMIRVEDRILGDHRQGARFVVLLPAIKK